MPESKETDAKIENVPTYTTRMDVFLVSPTRLAEKLQADPLEKLLTVFVSSQKAMEWGRSQFDEFFVQKIQLFL